MSTMSDMIKRTLETYIKGAEAKVYETGDDLLIEVISRSFDDARHVDNQDLVLAVLTTHANLGQRFFIQLLTYSDKASSFNSLARLCTIPSRWNGRVHTSTLAATDAYVYLAEIDAARLKYGWKNHEAGEELCCNAIQADDDTLASFKIREGASYRELEIDGQHHRIRSDLNKLPDGIWAITVTIGSGFGDGYAMG